jgi:hypothetical protein
MMIPTDLMLHTRQQELMREAEKFRLIHLVKAHASDQLEKYGATILKDGDKKQKPSHN